MIFDSNRNSTAMQKSEDFSVQYLPASKTRPIETLEEIQPVILMDLSMKIEKLKTSGICWHFRSPIKQKNPVFRVEFPSICCQQSMKVQKKKIKPAGWEKKIKNQQTSLLKAF